MNSISHIKRLLILLLMASSILIYTPATYAEDHPVIQVYKSPTCGCCKAWVKYLEFSGFEVEVSNDMQEIDALRTLFKIASNEKGCHTAVVDGYIIEGHVGAEEIRRLLAQKPEIKGLAVPGMPNGSPGMTPINAEPYDTLALRRDNTSYVFSTREAESPE